MVLHPFRVMLGFGSGSLTPFGASFARRLSERADAYEDQAAVGSILAAETTPSSTPGEFWGHWKPPVKQHIDALAADHGIASAQLAERNTAMGEGGLPEERRAIIAKHRWEKNFYSS